MKLKLTISLAALFFCTGLFSVSPAAAQSSFEAGLTQFKQGEYEKAIKPFEQARKESPSSSNTAFYLGLTYKILKKYKEAIPHLRDAVTLTPAVKDALPELIFSLYQTNNLDELVKSPNEITP